MGHFGRLTGISWKFGPPRRIAACPGRRTGVPAAGDRWRSRCPAQSGREKATCSVSAKKLSGLRSSTILPTGVKRNQLLGDQLGGIEDVERKRTAVFSSNIWTASSHSGKSPLAMASNRSRRWNPDRRHRASRPRPNERRRADLRAPMELHERRFPAASMKRNVWTPKPSIIRSDRGSVRSDIAHIIMCMLSGISDTKSQKVSWAEPPAETHDRAPSSRSARGPGTSSRPG